MSQYKALDKIKQYRKQLKEASYDMEFSPRLGAESLQAARQIRSSPEFDKLRNLHLQAGLPRTSDNIYGMLRTH